ncbi:MAG: hypothetical protein GY946_20010, partial [bacterium]|nr:hypothetical protein [bacterium]
AHVLGLGHAHYERHDNGRRWLGLDGVMNNSYSRDRAALIDPTDPRERYALEPATGAYLDDSTFGPIYSRCDLRAGQRAQQGTKGGEAR